MRFYALIASCAGVYSVADTARYFGLTPCAVQKVWADGEKYPEIEPPNIWDAQPQPGLLDEDARILRARGMSVREVADTLGMSCAWVARAVAK